MSKIQNRSRRSASAARTARAAARMAAAERALLDSLSEDHGYMFLSFPGRKGSPTTIMLVRDRESGKSMPVMGVMLRVAVPTKSMLGKMILDSDAKKKARTQAKSTRGGP